MRGSIAFVQLGFYNLYFFMYLLSPKFGHRFVGYLEEQAVHTYTLAIESYDKGRLPMWKNMPIVPEGADYYGLDKETATMRDLLLSVRADEACHRSVNHHFSDIPDFYAAEQELTHMSEDGFKVVDDEGKPTQSLGETK